jgi:hypothetical protein
LSSLRLALLPALALLAGCSTVRESEPPRTATEELLISSAVDHALAGLQVDIPVGTKVWVSADYLDGYDQKYAIGAIRDYFLHRGARLMPDRGSADAVVEIRSGALSTNSGNMLVGLPSVTVPVPTVGATQTPEISLLKQGHKLGVAKIGITIYDAKTGTILPYSPRVPAYGLAHNTDWSLLSVFGWKRTDALPAGSE